VKGRQARVGWIPASTDTSVASTRLRCALPSRWLRDAGWACELVDGKDPYAYDLVVFQKIYDEEAIELARSLRRRGVVTVFDLCDNHFYNPDNMPALEKRAVRLERMLDCVQAVTVSTEALQAILEGRETVVIDDALDELQLSGFRRLATRVERAASRRLRVVWYGGVGLESPPFGLIHLPRAFPALEALARTTPLELTVISNSREKFRAVTAETSFPTRYVEWSLGSFAPVFSRHDICVIPIEPNPFTICKTGNRVALSLRLGVPVVADPIASFLEFSDFVLLGDWQESLERYASAAELRRRHASEGQRYVEATYTKERVVRQWGDFFERLLSGAADDPTAVKEVSISP
jgi:hypothetical protein